MSYTPPKSVQKAAALGLKLRRRYGRGGLTNKQASEQGIGSGVQRAVNLKNGDDLTLDTIRRMKAFFDRHRVYKERGYHDSGDSASYISWLLWGGDPGYEWAKDVLAKQQEESVMMPQLIHDLEDLLDRENDDRRMVSSALEQAGRAAADILAILAQAEDGSVDSWMEYKIYRAADALRAVRDSLDVKKN